MENRPLAIGILASVAVLLLVTGCGDGADHTGMTEAEPTVIADQRVDKKTVPTPNAGTKAKYVIDVFSHGGYVTGLRAMMNSFGDVAAGGTVWECPSSFAGPCKAPRALVGSHPGAVGLFWGGASLTDGFAPSVIYWQGYALEPGQWAYETVSTPLDGTGTILLGSEGGTIITTQAGDAFVYRAPNLTPDCQQDCSSAITRYGPAGFKKQDPFAFGHLMSVAWETGDLLTSMYSASSLSIIDRNFNLKRTIDLGEEMYYVTSNGSISNDGTSTVHYENNRLFITVLPPPEWTGAGRLRFNALAFQNIRVRPYTQKKLISRRGVVVGGRQYQHLILAFVAAVKLGDETVEVEGLYSRDFLIELTYGPAGSRRMRIAATGPISRVFALGELSIGEFKNITLDTVYGAILSGVLTRNGSRSVSRDDESIPALLVEAHAMVDGKWQDVLLRARRVCDVSHSENTLQDVKQGATPHGDICANPSRPTTGLLSCDPDPSNPLKKRTIRNVGCALTGFTNVVNFFNGTNVPIADADNKTDDFNTMLADAGMFDGESNLRFADVTNAHMLTNIYSQVWNLRYFGRDAPGVHPGGDGADVTTRETFVDDPLSPIVDFFVCNGEPVIVKVANCKVGGGCTGHFVVATGRGVARRVGELSDQATALINDPARLSSPPDLLQDGPLTGPNRWHRANRIYGVRAYSKQQFAGGGKTHVGLLINSPVEVLVQDPLGRRLGYDHLSGETFDEIPNAALTDDSFATPDGEPVSHARHIAIGGPEDVFGNQPGGVSQGAVHGTYSFVVRGTGEGPFTLTFSSLDSEGGVRNRIVAGYARQGSVETIQLERHPTGEAVLFRSSIGARTRADVDYNGAVDRSDVDLITRARGRAADGADDPLDVDQDGQITALDARRATLLCTRPRCATQ